MKYTYYILFFTVFSIFCRETVEAGDAPDCKCGKRHDHSFRIVGGKVAEPHSFPWIAALKHIIVRIIFCGGALINDRYVITAGHCVATFRNQFYVVLGMHDKIENDGIEFRVKEIIIHKGFRDNGGYDINDIALIKLNEIVQFSRNIKPVCLPTSDNDYSNAVAQVAGWGTTKYKVAGGSDKLKETDLKVLGVEECKNHKHIGRYIQDTMLCAYRALTDTCQGDSGGPLTYETHSGKNELIGIVSWGLECGLPNTPGIYTRVTSYLDWIAKNTKDGIYCQK